MFGQRLLSSVSVRGGYITPQSRVKLSPVACCVKGLEPGSIRLNMSLCQKASSK